MRRISIFFAFLLTGSLLLAAGCGGSSSGSKSGASVPGADMAPASALAFVSINSDMSGTQWKQAMQLLSRFPTVEQSLSGRLGNSGVSLTDVEQALGTHTDVVLMGTTASPLTVLLTDSSNPAKVKSLLSSSGGSAVSTSVGSWTAVADSQATLDQLKSETGKGKLSDSGDFKDAVASLPSDALAKVYLSGAEMAQAVSSATSSSSLSGIVGKNQPKWAGIAASTSADGLMLQADIQTSTSIGSGSSSTLVDELPSATSLVIDFSGKALGLDKVFNKEATGSQLGTAETALGITSDQISGLLGSEMALYGTESGFGLLIKAPQADKLLATIDRVALLAGAQAGVTVNPVTIAGISAKELVIRGIHVDYGVENGNLFFVTDAASLPGSAKLSADPVYSAAAKQLNVPGSKRGGVLRRLLQAGLADPERAVAGE